MPAENGTTTPRTPLEDGGKQNRVSVLKIVTAVMLLFTFSNVFHEYMDVKQVKQNYGYSLHNLVQSVTNMNMSSLEFDMGYNSSSSATQAGMSNNNDNPQDGTAEAENSQRPTTTRFGVQSSNPYQHGYLPLPQLTRAHENVTCEDKWMIPFQCIVDPIADKGQGRKIPKIVHITGKHKCSIGPFVDGAKEWAFSNHSLYFHDDQAVHSLLFEREWPEFPQLKNSWECLKNSGGAALADLWRYVAMWEYGGIYTDMDNLPGPYFNASTITPDMDAFFLQEQGGFVSQYFFAVAPKHPIMFLAVHDVMHQMHTADDTGKMYIPFATGPGTTKRSFIRFMGGTSKSPQKFLDKYGYPEAGLYIGKFGNNRSVTVEGSRQTSGQWVRRSALGRAKKKAWKMMNVTDYQQVNKQATGQTCLEQLHDWHATQRQDFVEEQLRRWRF